MKWKKGQSGNPTGRAKGSRNRATVACDDLLAGEAEKLTRKAVELALGGDTVALRLCLERVVPVRRGAPVRLELPDGSNGNPSTYAHAVLEAATSGNLTPEEAASMMGVVEAYRRALETGELMERMNRLERELEA